MPEGGRSTYQRKSGLHVKQTSNELNSVQKVVSIREIYKKTDFEISLSVQILNIKTRTRTKSQQNQSRHMIRKSLRKL